jgi:hypothetical protein
MSLWRNGEEAKQVPIECVVQSGEPPDHQQLVSGYAAIGSAEEWARRCGEAACDDPQTWEAVAMLLVVGTRKYNATSLALGGFRRLCPDATAAAFWIFCHTDHHSHNKVYAELLICLAAGPDSRNFRDWEEFAEKSLEHVSDNLAREFAYMWKGKVKGKGKGATTSNSSPYAASSGVRHVDGNS